MADKGRHPRGGLKELEDGAWRSRIAERKVPGVSRRRGDEAARRAAHDNRARLRSGAAGEAFELRAELVGRGFALALDRGGMRRARLRGRENVQRRHLARVAGCGLGLVMRLPVGAGAPRGFLARTVARLFALATAEGAALFVLVVTAGAEAAMLAAGFGPGPHD